MTFADKRRYAIILQKITYKGGELEMSYIKRFQNAQALSVSVGKSYYEYQLINIFLDNFHQCVKYTAYRAIHQAELRREKNY